jgi:CBS domain-containing protein
MRVGGGMTTKVVEVRPADKVSVAIARMNDAGVGSVMVCDGARLAGIFTERDVLRLAGGGESFVERPVGDVMTTSLLTVTAEDTVEDAARLMRERRIRHLPVVEGENLVGVISIRDVMRLLVERVWSAHDETAHDTARDLLRRR